MSTRTALITGASSGIGSELAKLFAADGTNVVLVARREERLRDLAAEIEGQHGITATVLSKDLAQPGGARDLIDAVHERDLEINTLVNNAGFGTHGRFHETDLNTETDIITLHVTAVTELTKHFLRRMVERGTGEGEILNTVSMSAMAPTPQEAVYSATKAYQLSLTESIGHDYETEGVIVTALCPGPVDTEFYDRADFGDAMEGVSFNDPASVARAGYEGLKNGERLVIPSTMMKVMAQVKRVLPRQTLVSMADGTVSEEE